MPRYSLLSGIIFLILHHMSGFSFAKTCLGVREDPFFSLPASASEEILHGSPSFAPSQEDEISPHCTKNCTRRFPSSAYALLRRPRDITQQSCFEASKFGFESCDSRLGYSWLEVYEPFFVERRISFFILFIIFILIHLSTLLQL